MVGRPEVEEQKDSCNCEQYGKLSQWFVKNQYRKQDKEKESVFFPEIQFGRNQVDAGNVDTDEY